MGERGSSLGLLMVTSATPWGCGTRMPSQREWESDVEKDSWRSGFCPPCSWESLDGYKEFSRALNDYRVMIWVWWILSQNIWESHYLCLVNPCRDRLIVCSSLPRTVSLQDHLARAGASFPLSWIWAGLWLTLNRRVGQKWQCVHSKPRPLPWESPRLVCWRTRAHVEESQSPRLQSAKTCKQSHLATCPWQGSPAKGERTTRGSIA